MTRSYKAQTRVVARPWPGRARLAAGAAIYAAALAHALIAAMHALG